MASAAVQLRSFEELYAEIEALDEHLTGEILEPGVVRVMPRPGRAHRLAQKQLARALGPIDVDAGGAGWWIELEPEVRLGDRLVVPDLCGWRVERLAQPPTGSPIATVPDWACEILSPSNARDDRRLKLPLYASAGVGHTWLVEPASRLVEVFASQGGRAAQIATAVDEDALELPPFVGLVLNLATLWEPAQPR